MNPLLAPKCFIDTFTWIDLYCDTQHGCNAVVSLTVLSWLLSVQRVLTPF